MCNRMVNNGVGYLKFREMFTTSSRLLSIEATFNGIVRNRGTIPGNENLYALAILDRSRWSMRFEEEELSAAGTTGLRVLENGEKLTAYINSTERAQILYATKVRQLDDVINQGCDAKKLSEVVAEVFDSYSDLLAHYRFTNEEFMHRLEEHLERCLKKGRLSFGDGKYMLESSSSLFYELFDWAEVKRAVLAKKCNVKSILAEHSRKYGFLIANSFKETEDTISFFNAKLERELAQEPNREISGSGRNLLDGDEGTLDEDELILIHRIRQLGIARLRLRETFTKYNLLFTRALTKHRKRFPLLGDVISIPRLWQVVGFDDLLEIIIRSDRQSIRSAVMNDLESRTKGMSCLLIHNMVSSWCHSRDVSVKTSERGSGNLRGQTANGVGPVYGKTLCIPSLSENNDSDLQKKLSPDTILVTRSLHPDLMVYLGHCRCIITDEGGVLSHAGTIARELGIPCIVGTRVGTEVLKSGELVEVDLDTGVIRRSSKDSWEEPDLHLEGCLSGEYMSKGAWYYCTYGKVVSCFSETWSTDEAKKNFGVKAWKLAEYRHEFRVPRSVLLLREECERLTGYSKIANEIESLRGASIDGKLEHALKQIRDEILNAKEMRALPEQLLDLLQDWYPLIVRSSSIQEDCLSMSSAGLLSSVDGILTDRDLHHAILKVLASPYTTANAKYLHMGNQLEAIPNCTVLIQCSIPWITKGVIFTTNPIRDNENVMVIDVEHRGAERVTVQFDKSRRELIDVDDSIEISHVEEEDLRAVAELGSRIETKEQMPMDIEWCIDDERSLYLLQVRPITTLRSGSFDC